MLYNPNCHLVYRQVTTLVWLSLEHAGINYHCLLEMLVFYHS
jgi:hypothetical protein